MDKLRAVFCALFSHSNIEHTCFGYHYCGRCDAQIGDSLGGAYSNESIVGRDCDCEICERNYKRLTWRDKLLAPTPIVAKSTEERRAAKEEKNKAKAALKALVESRRNG